MNLQGGSTGSIADRLRLARQRRLQKDSIGSSTLPSLPRTSIVSEFRVLQPLATQDSSGADATSRANAAIIERMSLAELNDSIESAVDLIPPDLIEKIRAAREASGRLLRQEAVEPRPPSSASRAS